MKKSANAPTIWSVLTSLRNKGDISSNVEGEIKAHFTFNGHSSDDQISDPNRNLYKVFDRVISIIVIITNPKINMKISGVAKCSGAVLIVMVFSSPGCRLDMAILPSSLIKYEYNNSSWIFLISIATLRSLMNSLARNSNLNSKTLPHKHIVTCPSTVSPTKKCKSFYYRAIINLFVNRL